ncbi:MAG: AAA domain-containing protein [Planctomycetaceae bacterium]
MLDHDEADDDELLEDSFVQARFPIRLDLPEANSDSLDDAKEAIRREFRDSVKWKRLRCRSVKVLSETETGTVFILEVGHAVEFDWTWEGAVAFRPLLLKEFADDPKSLFGEETDEIDIEDSILWTGEILEVDEATGRIFVVVSNPEHPPTTGSFYVRPFEFLAFLNAVFHEPAFDQIREMLPSRLLAAEGGVHPDVDAYRDIGLTKLKLWWSKAWSILWGPPGTGKTFTTGHQVANVLADETERVLVVSTTNRATDAAAIAIGRAAKDVAPTELANGSLLRIGKGASLQKFESEDLTAMLRGTETEFLAQIEELVLQLARATDSETKALIRKQIKELREQMRDAAQRNFLDEEVRGVVATAFRATTFLKCEDVKDDIERGVAPFTTIFIDEAGLISRAAVAALSLLASRRVVLVGDSKQLAPISRISRILPTNQMTWLANSGLSHLESIKTDEFGVHVLQEQRRMHADVCSVVSAYQYDGFLTTAPEVNSRAFSLPDVLCNQPRTIWYVLDDDGEELPAIRAERGPGNRSWIRVATTGVLDRLFSDPSMRAATGMFISPFKAQAKDIASYLATNELHSWSASTVHSQQGSEADIVVFDTVNAGSYSWPYDEWKRLVNVALSRSREAIVVLSSRAEMDEPYLRPLLRHLAPKVLRKQGKKLTWESVPAKVEYSPPNGSMVRDANSVGYQLAKRKELRPVLSHEQERLCGLELDGKPRLVRGVAGSGKTVVLAHWLMQTVRRLAGQQNVRIWAVFANRSLQSLIGDSIESAWEKETGGKSFPWDRVSLRHIREILDVLLPEAGLSSQSFGFEYDDAAAAYLSRKSVDDIKPRCDALFIDEAQDMGPNTLKLLAGIVRQADDDDNNSRSVNIFYDNAQNIYGRGTPTWSELGLDMRGRSTVMKESFRSTKPITEFALNVLYRLQPPENNPDHKEMVTRGLIERTQRNGTDWWTVRFNQIDGPKPSFRQYMNLDQEFEAIADYCRELIEVEGVQPSDICLLYNGKNIKYRLETQVAPRLADLGVEFSVQTNKPFERSSRILLATTSHSFKGYDSEVVIVPAADQYTANDKGVLANNLYVAMTRARSILTVFAQKMNNRHARHLYEVIEDCLDNLHERPKVDNEISPQDDLVDILDIIGNEHRKWLTGFWNQTKLNQEPILTKSGEIVAEPLFWMKAQEGLYACFGTEPPRQRVVQRLEDLGIRLLAVGQEIGGGE